MSSTAVQYISEALLFTKSDGKTGVFQRRYDFEWELLDIKTWKYRMENYWHYSLYTCVAYVLLIFGIQRYMKDRPKFYLRGPLVAWNLGLAIFSMCGAVRSTLDLIIIQVEDGFYRSVCDNKYFDPQSESCMAFWGVVFVLSKIPELGDTVFVVLRKQKLIFLHWYHHTTVLVFCVLCHSENTASSTWFLTMNFSVHAFMYLYYAIRAAGYRLPMPVCMSITVMQIAQMVMGCVLLIYSYMVKSRGFRCDISYGNLTYGGLMYLSYFILFANFFYQTYFVKKDKMMKGKKTA